MGNTQSEPVEIIINDSRYPPVHNHYYEPHEKDPVIHTQLQDVTLSQGDDHLFKVEYQTRPESRGKLKIIVEHNDSIVKEGSPATHKGVTTLRVHANGENVYGTWAVHVLDLNFKRLASTLCTITQPRNMCGY